MLAPNIHIEDELQQDEAALTSQSVIGSIVQVQLFMQGTQRKQGEGHPGAQT